METASAPQKTYTITFRGRTVGAIGIFYTIKETVTALSEKAAVLSLYDRYEHIHVIALREEGNC